MRILLIAEHTHDEIKDVTHKTLTAASMIGGEIDILVAGNGSLGAAEMASRLPGIGKVLHCDDSLFTRALAENMSALIVPLMSSYDILIAPATTNGKSFCPRVAALLDVMQISDITAVLGPDSFERPTYAGNAIETVRSSESQKVITVRTAAFAAVEGEGGPVSIEAISAPANPGLSEYMDEQLTISDRPELTSARIVISGGRGMQSGDNFVLLEKIADRLKAAVGASRAAVDAGYVPNDYQVGQTGKVISPDLYIAVGISGAIQHLAGMKDSKTIVAINKDEEAPIFQIADYGLVADLFEALPALEKALANAGY